MPFGLESMERIYADIVSAGHEAGFMVVPEFKLSCGSTNHPRAKKPDVVWVVARKETAVECTTPPYRVLAAFEVEGFNVPLDTMDHHVRVYRKARRKLKSEFPCYVAIYSRALHRVNYGRDAKKVEQCLQERRHQVANDRDVIEVCDGTERDWLRRASELAKRDARAWLRRISSKE